MYVCVCVTCLYQWKDVDESMYFCFFDKYGLCVTDKRWRDILRYHVGWAWLVLQTLTEESFTSSFYHLRATKPLFVKSVENIYLRLRLYLLIAVIKLFSLLKFKTTKERIKKNHCYWCCCCCCCLHWVTDNKKKTTGKMKINVER